MNLRTLVACAALCLCATSVQADCHRCHFPVARTVVVETVDLAAKTVNAVACQVKTHVVEPARELTSVVVRRVKCNACERQERRACRCNCWEPAPVFDGTVETGTFCSTK